MTPGDLRGRGLDALGCSTDLASAEKFEASAVWALTAAIYSVGAELVAAFQPMAEAAVLMANPERVVGAEPDQGQEDR